MRILELNISKLGSATEKLIPGKYNAAEVQSCAILGSLSDAWKINVKEIYF